MIEIDHALLAKAGESAQSHDRMGEFTEDYILALLKGGLFDAKPATVEQYLTEYLSRLSELSIRCPSTAFIAHMHYCASVYFERLAPGASRGLSSRRSQMAPIFCSLNSEPGMHYRRRTTRVSQIEHDDRSSGAVRVQAAKHFCSGIRFADHAFSFIGDRFAGRSVATLIPLNLEGIKVGDPFELLGLRATDSRSVAIDVPIPRSSVFEGTDRLPTHLWSLGYTAILQGIGTATVDALFEVHDGFNEDGRWGEWEARELGRLLHLQQNCVAALKTVAAAGLEAGSRLALTAKLTATDFATTATKAALHIVGGESAAMYSPWSRRFRDATTMALLPPGEARSLLLLGRHQPGSDLDVAIPPP